jgi:hypothetical protein
MLEQFLLTTYVDSGYRYLKYSHSGNTLTTTGIAVVKCITRKHFVIVQPEKSLIPSECI